MLDDSNGIVVVRCKAVQFSAILPMRYDTGQMSCSQFFLCGLMRLNAMHYNTVNAVQCRTKYILTMPCVPAQCGILQDTVRRAISSQRCVMRCSSAK